MGNGRIANGVLYGTLRLRQILYQTRHFLRIYRKRTLQGLVLSGGAPRIGLDGSLGNCAEYLEKADFPILGICAGHQFMARHFGGEVKPSTIPEFGQVEMTLIKDDDALFEGVSKKIDCLGIPQR